MHRNHGIPSGVLFISLLLMLPAMGNTQSYSSGSTGADGPFNPTSNTTLTLPATGVFNFTTINIPSGVTVTFTKNATNTPAILLATGNVTISGAIDVSGSAAGGFGRPGQGGPGGFDGGAGGDGLTMTAGGTGLGPGAGGGGSGSGAAGGGGGHGSSGGSGYFGCGGCTNGGGGSTYGSSALRPMVGGSGGGGGAGNIGSSIGGGGGGGGGAILIASSTSIAIHGNPAILANGGSGGNGYAGGGGGSGGAIRLIAPTITGTGSLRAQAGSGYYYGGAGGNGRIRIEATTLAYTGSTTPVTLTSLPQPVFPGSGQPALAIASIAGITTPANPVGSVLGAPDIMLPVGTPNPVAVVLAANNVPLGTTVQLSATPQSGNKTTAACTLLDGTQASSACTASITISLTQTNILTASATFPLVASAGDGPIYAEGPVPSLGEGEEVKWVRIASSLGGPPTVTYITASGKEVPATALAGRVP